MMDRILIAGATGYLGIYVVKAFKKSGYWIRIISREANRLKDLEGHFDEAFIGEVTVPVTLKDACKNIDVVFSSIGITRQKDKVTYRDVDYQGNLNLLNEAIANNVKKFIYVSVLNAHKMENLKIVEAKSAFSKELTRSGINYAIVFPNGFFSDMAEMLEMAKRGRGYFFNHGRYRANPIHGEDLAQFCVDIVTSSDRQFEVGGPDIMTHKEIYGLACQAIGIEEKTMNIPNWIKDMVLLIMRLFTSSRVYGPLEFFMAVMSMDMIGKQIGKRHLKDFFIEKAGG
jgi:uncharacterized protein YbjT (DUF2867 family)